MSNGDIPQWNCIAGICCLLAEDRKAALAKNLAHHLCEKHPHFTATHCDEIADVVIEQMDAAFGGTLAPFMAAVGELAKGPSFR